MNTSTLRLALVATLATSLLRAGEPGPEKAVQASTWRPYKEAKEILFFENFERALPYIKEGKIFSDDPVPPGGHALQMADRNADHAIGAKFDLGLTQLKIPAGFNPNLTFLQLNVYCEDSGDLKFKFHYSGGDLDHTVPVPKAKGWGAVTIKLADVRTKTAKAEIEQLFTSMEVTITPPKNRKVTPKGYIDSLLFTYGANPNDIRPRLIAAERRRIEMERNPERNGFNFSMPIHDYLAQQLKPFKGHWKSKNVMVLGPTPELTQAWVKALAAAAPKVKETGYVFKAAVEPGAEDKPIGGLADSRTLLQYNLQKDPEILLLIVSADDAIGPGRPSESVHIAVERALGAGTLPLIVLPAPPTADEKDKVAEFSRVTAGYAPQWGVPFVDAAFVAKNAKGAIDPALVGQASFDKLVLLTMNALKHIHDNMAKE